MLPMTCGSDHSHVHACFLRHGAYYCRTAADVKGPVHLAQHWRHEALEPDLHGAASQLAAGTGVHLISKCILISVEGYAMLPGHLQSLRLHGSFA